MKYKWMMSFGLGLNSCQRPHHLLMLCVRSMGTIHTFVNFDRIKIKKVPKSLFEIRREIIAAAVCTLHLNFTIIFIASDGIISFSLLLLLLLEEFKYVFMSISHWNCCLELKTVWSAHKLLEWLRRNDKTVAYYHLWIHTMLISCERVQQ